MSSSKNDNFTSLFPIWVSFISFYFLTTLARTFSTMLSNSGESRHPRLVPDLKGNFSDDSTLVNTSLKS